MLKQKARKEVTNIQSKTVSFQMLLNVPSDLVSVA